jgi:hypothetical protein
MKSLFPHNLHETYQLPRVQLITPDDGHSRCPKHVEFRDKIKFWIHDASCLLFIRRSNSIICFNLIPLIFYIYISFSAKSLFCEYCLSEFCQEQSVWGRWGVGSGRGGRFHPFICPNCALTQRMNDAAQIQCLIGRKQFILCHIVT